MTFQVPTNVARLFSNFWKVVRLRKKAIWQSGDDRVTVQRLLNTFFAISAWTNVETNYSFDAWSLNNFRVTCISVEFRITLARVCFSSFNYLVRVSVYLHDTTSWHSFMIKSIGCIHNALLLKQNSTDEAAERFNCGSGKACRHCFDCAVNTNT